MRSFSATLSAVVVLGLTSAARAGDVPVMVLPFADEGGGSSSWVGKSIQQSLAGDVGRGGGFKAVSPTAAGAPSDDLAVAISAARQANVPYVVFGSYQVRGERLNVVANAVDVEKMRFVGAVNVSRDAKDIFSATDAVGSHVVGHLNHARGNAHAGLINTPPNAVGASPVSRFQMPLTSVPLSYVDWAAAARPKTARSSQWAKMLPGPLVVDYPLEHIPKRLLPPTRDPRMPFQNQNIQSDGNQVTRGDGTTVTGGDGNTIQRGDGNSLSFNRTDTIPQDRGFGNTMQFNRGPSKGATNVPGAGVGNSVNGPTAGHVRPQSGRAVQPQSGRAVQPGSGSAVRPQSGNAVAPAGNR